MDLALNNLGRLICHKTQPINQPITIFQIRQSMFGLALTTIDK